MLEIEKYLRGYGQPVPSSVLIPPMIVSTITHFLPLMLGGELGGTDGATVTTN